MCEYSNDIENPQKDNTITANSGVSVQNLINKFEQISYKPPLKVRTDSTNKVRKYLSLNIMNETDAHLIPILNQNVVNQFLQTQNSSFKTSGSVRETKSKSERDQKKRSESFRQGNKKSSDSFLNKYFRSLSDSKTSKRNGNPVPVPSSKWYSKDNTSESIEPKANRNLENDQSKKKTKANGFSGEPNKKTNKSTSNHLDYIPKKKLHEQTNSTKFNDVPKKKFHEQTNSSKFENIPKKKIHEQTNSSKFEDVPKKKFHEQTNSTKFEDVAKKKFNEQTNSTKFEDVPKKKFNEQTNSTKFDDVPKKKFNEQRNSIKFDDVPQKQSKKHNISIKFEQTPKKTSNEHTMSKENNTVQNVPFRRKSYVLAMQTDRSVDIDIDEPPPREEVKNSYVNKILSRFEDKNNDNIKQEVTSDVDKLFQHYRKKTKITGEIREKLSLEINDILLEKYKQLKHSSEDELAQSNLEIESPTSPEENEEVECITLIYNEDDGKLTKYSEQECLNMETKYMITLNETLDPDDSTKINEQKIEEIKVIENGSTLDLNTNENVNKSMVQDLCDKIQEQLKSVIKTIEIEEISSMGTKTLDEAKENIFEFWQRQSTSSENIQTKHDEIKNPNVSFDTKEEKIDETAPQITESENIDEKTKTQIVEEDDPNITDQRRSSNLFSNLSTNSDVPEDKPRFSRLYSGSFKRRSQASEENKNKVEARNSFLNSLRLSFKSNCDEDNDKRDRRSFRSSLFGDKKEENKNDERRNSFIVRRNSSVASCSSYKNELADMSGNKEDTKSSKNKRESIASCSSYTNETKTFESSEELNTKQTVKNENCLSSKKMNLLEPNKHSFLNSRRSSYTSNISETDEETPRRSILYRESFKKLLPGKENEETYSGNKQLPNESSSYSSMSSENSHSSKAQHNNEILRRSSTEKPSKEDPPQEDSLVRQDAPRMSRLYSAKFQYKDTKQKDDNNNNPEESKKETKDSIIQFASDNEEETVEICNPYFSYISKDAYTKEWVQNTVEHLSLQKVKEPEPNEEKQFSAQLRRTVDKNGLETCTVYDEQNNPAIRLSCYDILLDVFSEEFNEEQMKINQSEKQYRESIEDIQNNSQLACLIAELKSTEHNYVKNSLRRLVKDYMPEMSRPDVPLNLVGKVRTIFGNADILYESHKSKFLPALEASQSVEDIAKCFLKYEEKIFKYYPLYTKNKPKSELIMRDYANFFKHKQEVLQDRLDLSSYLLTPIQRMAKYCQLVKSMVKECEKEGKPSEKLNKASEMLAKLMSKGNDLIALDSILNFDGDLRQEGDLLLRDTFIVQPPHRKQSYEGMIFLFQESILITQITRHSGCESFEYQDSIKVCDMGYTDNQAEPLVFKIWYRKRDQKNYVIRANKKEKQQKWVKEIFNLLWKQLEANKMRKKKEYEESGLNEIKVPLPTRPISEPNNKNNMFKSRSNSTMKKKTLSETIWYSSFMKKLDFNDS